MVRDTSMVVATLACLTQFGWWFGDAHKLANK